MPRLRLIGAILPCLLLAGCFQLRALVRLNHDGSGTLEETVMFGGMIREMMNEADSAAVPTLYHIDSLRAHASALGVGVTLLRVDSVEEGDDFGYRAVYRFDDVSTVRFRFNSNIMPARGAGRAPGRGSAAMLAGTSPNLPVAFARDADGTIRIQMPQPAATTPARLDRARVASLADSMRMQMQSAGPAVSEVLGGMRLLFAIEGPGAIETTDASFPEDSAIVLFDYSLGAFVDLMREKPELVARAQLLERAGTPDTRPVMRALASRPDVRYELRPEVTVRFRR